MSSTTSGTNFSLETVFAPITGPKPMLTQGELARLLGWSPAKVRRLTARGLLPCIVDPDSGRVEYPRAAIERWLADTPIGGRS